MSETPRITLTGPSALQRADAALRIADVCLDNFNNAMQTPPHPSVMDLHDVVRNLRNAVGALVEHAQTEALHAQLARGIREAERGETVNLTDPDKANARIRELEDALGVQVSEHAASAPRDDDEPS